MMSLHSACPTIFGIKWGMCLNLRKYSNMYILIFHFCISVSNKWIREGDQLFKRPCDLTKDEI